MSSEGSVTRWIRQLKAGDHDAARLLWQRYFDRLVRVARQKLRGSPRRAVDEEDVAAHAFDSFCRGVERGRFPQMQNRQDLWRLLLKIAAHKAFDQRRRELQQKHGQGKVPLGLTDPHLSSASDEETLLQQLVSSEPTPEFAAILAEEWQQLMDRLDNDELRSIALRKLEGYTNDELARKQGCGLRTVERKLQLIRDIWTKANLS
jgi:DNA-directed RNA polymerase specialized sigma24 family protein